MEDLLPLRTGADDAERSKPDPDIVQAALKLAGVSAQDAVLVGDTPYDRDAAHRAGVAFMGVRSGGWSEQELRGARAVYRDVGELLAHFDDSPLGLVDETRT